MQFPLGIFHSLNRTEKQYFLVSLLLFVVASIFSTGFHHFDEHFQILEFASLKWGATTPAQLPWEFNSQIRPTLQPALVVLVHQCLALFGKVNPFFLAWILRFLSAVVCWYLLLQLYLQYRPKNPISKGWSTFLWMQCLTWFLIYTGVRFSSENWSALCFIPALLLAINPYTHSVKLFLTLGFLLGLSFLFRFQAAFMIAGIGLWLLIIKRIHFHCFLLISTGFVAAFALGTVIDYWFYGEWTFSFWNYFVENIINKRAAAFGTQPWYWYFTQLGIQGPPLTLLYLGAFFLAFRFAPKHPLLWVITLFIAGHVVVGHKETRFLFPILPLLPALFISVYLAIQQRANVNKPWFKVVLKTSWIVNLVLLTVVTFKPAGDSQIGLYRKIYNQHSDATTLYYANKNPYYRGDLDMVFYKQPILKTKPFEERSFINMQSGTLFIEQSRGKPKVQVPGNFKLVYQSFPNWMYNYNLGGWLDRTNSWYLYEVE